MALEQTPASVPSTGATMVPAAGPKTVDRTNVQKDISTKTSTKVKVQPTPQPEAAAPVKKPYRVKMNNEERVLELDDNEVLTHIQMGYGADRKFKEAAQLRREADDIKANAEAYKERLKKETDVFLRENGIDPRQFAETYLAGVLEKELMDPRDRQIMELKAENDRIKKGQEEKAAQETADREAKELDGYTQAFKDSFAKNIGAALKNSALPQTERTVGKVASYMKYCIANEIPYTLENIRDRVIDDYRNDFKHLFASAEAAQIADIIGEDAVKKIRQWDNERVRKGPTQPSNGKDSNAARNATNKIYQKKKYKTIEQDNIDKYGHPYAPLIDDY